METVKESDLKLFLFSHRARSLVTVACCEETALCSLPLEAHSWCHREERHV